MTPARTPWATHGATGGAEQEAFPQQVLTPRTGPEIGRRAFTGGTVDVGKGSKPGLLPDGAWCPGAARGRCWPALGWEQVGHQASWVWVPGKWVTGRPGPAPPGL